MKELERHMRIFTPDTVEEVAKAILIACVKREDTTLIFHHHLSTKEVAVHVVNNRTADALLAAGILTFPNTFMVNYETIPGSTNLDDMKDAVYHAALRYFIIPVMGQ